MIVTVYQRMTEKIRMSRSVIANTYEIIPNPDFLHRKEVEKAIEENDGYCCCKMERIPQNKCICKEFSE